MKQSEGLDQAWQRLSKRYIVEQDHQQSDYFGLIKELLALRAQFGDAVSARIETVYRFVLDEIVTSTAQPRSRISFGTSGWRGMLGKDITVVSVRCVTEAIIRMYRRLDEDSSLAAHLGVASRAEACRRGCLVGYDNRFAGQTLGRAVADVLLAHGFKVYFCGETTTGVLSAALLHVKAAFSVNLTPSHNPLEYGGYKYNAADGGPAAAELTRLITSFARELISQPRLEAIDAAASGGELIQLDSFSLWQQLVDDQVAAHGIEYRSLLDQAARRDDLVLVVDAVHGASRLHIERLLGPAARHLQLLRGAADVTFGGIAPEPSSANMAGVTAALAGSSARLKIGAIIDPDGDRIRFTDGNTEIGMNQFGALAYYFLHEKKGRKGLVAKTVATSNLANAVAKGLGEEVFETKVGFKEFKPVIGKALVCFEESDGISIIGHTPEKDAYIGLVLALAMVLESGKNLGELLQDLELRYGAFYPDRDGVVVSRSGAELDQALAGLEVYRVGTTLRVGDEEKKIREVIDIDGRKMIFEDDSWLMIRPSGTEPKVRFYVESRSPDGTGNLVATAREMLGTLGLL
jgi:phosphomannomutase